jgi:hypothetical protein
LSLDIDAKPGKLHLARRQPKSSLSRIFNCQTERLMRGMQSDTTRVENLFIPASYSLSMAKPPQTTAALANQQFIKKNSVTL